MWSFHPCRITRYEMISQQYPMRRPRKVCGHLASIFLVFFFLLRSNVCDGRLNERKSLLDSTAEIVYPRGEFEPLKCNSKLDDAPCITPWSKVFGNKYVFSDLVEVPCGKCIVMYPLKKSLTFKGGLRILGKLVIHSNDILTTSILVHGELAIESLRPIDGIPDVSITWIDTPSNQSMSFRDPEDDSNDICGGDDGACGMGRKPFVVAGGKVNIRGLPSPSMPTWVPIYDVDKGSTTSSDSMRSLSESEKALYNYMPPKPGCPRDDVLIDTNFFSSSASDVFRGSYGSNYEWTPNGGLKITNRKHSQHCPVVDLKSVRHCLQVNKNYLLTAKLMLTQKGRSDLTNCALGKDDNDCMSIFESRMSSRGIGRTTTIWNERASYGTTLEEETTVSVHFNFTSSQINENNIYQVIQLRGPEAGVDMELLGVTFRALPEEAFPEPEKMCKDLVPTNGDAELLGFSPYPFGTNHLDLHLSVVEEGSNHYFELTGREYALENAKRGNWRNAGIAWEIFGACMKPHTKYIFSAEVRMHSMSPATAVWKMKAYVQGKRKPFIKPVAKCQKSLGTWVMCEGVFEPTSELFDAYRFEVYLESDTASYDVDYDVDNISFKLSDKALNRLILPNSIEDLWSVGSEILITSHTSKWDGHATRRIKSIEKHDEEGYVTVGLDETIDRPLTLGSHPLHATEVALLSRNIVFNGGNGAHMTILKTPDQTQVIQGIEFIGFGEESVHQSYPIYFDSCNDSPNSIVSRNTIRKSNQRCVVLDETNDVLVEENVAFGNKGHCFVVETGTEKGNIFKANLGAFCQKAETILSTSDYRGKETDDAPAMFWIGAPSNHWIGNIASGSEGSGFWIGPKMSHLESVQRTSFIESPHSMPLSEFTDNAAHSTAEESLKITGYNPTTQTASIKNFKSYLVNKGHIYASGSSNIAASGTVLDSELASLPFDMTDTILIGLNEDEEDSIDTTGTSKKDDHSHHASASNPTDVFNLQSSPSLIE